MTVGTTQYRGMAVPLRGEAELLQITAATDFVTLTGAASISGDFIVCRDSTGATEYFYVSAAGAVVGLSDATFTSTVTCKNITASTLITASKDITATSTVTCATLSGATVNASTGGTAKDYTVTSTLTVGSLTGAMVHTSMPTFNTGAKMLAGMPLRFSAPISTALATTGLGVGALYLVMKSATPQLAVQIGVATTVNALRYFTSNTATFGRASVT